MAHLNRFESLILFYIFHDCISEVSHWNEIFYWIAQEFKIVYDVMSTTICKTGCKCIELKMMINFDHILESFSGP